MLCGQVQRSVGTVVKVWVAQIVEIVADDALDQRQVVEEDGAPETTGYVNPGLVLEVVEDRFSSRDDGVLMALLTWLAQSSMMQSPGEHQGRVRVVT